MKSASLVILLPFLSVLILSLYTAGGVSRKAALILLGVSVIGLLAGFILKRSPNLDR
jgi:hypothetical protein